MRKRRLNLEEKIFVIRSYYANEQVAQMVRKEFENAYKVQSSEALLKTIALVVKRFESSGSVVQDVTLESGTLFYPAENTTPTKIKDEEILEDNMVEILPHPDIEFDIEVKPEAEDDIFYGVETTDEPLDEEGMSEEELVEEYVESDKDDKEYIPKKSPRVRDNVCNVCGIKSSSRAEYTEHKETHYKYPCEICKRPLPSDLDRLKHETSHFGKWEEEQIPCQICQKMIVPSGMRVHLGNHRNLKMCTICGKMVKDLRGHVNSHTRASMFDCELCPKKFTTKLGLKCHIRTHTGERPYKCETCGKGFIDHSTLRVHYRQHTGESPYVCQFCGKTCKQAQNLRSHIRHVHKEI